MQKTQQQAAVQTSPMQVRRGKYNKRLKDQHSKKDFPSTTMRKKQKRKNNKETDIPPFQSKIGHITNDNCKRK